VELTYHYKRHHGEHRSSSVVIPLKWDTGRYERE